MSKRPHMPYVGEVWGGKLDSDVRVQVADYIRTFKDGTRLEIVVKPYKPTRSARANAYYWGVVLKAIEQHGESGYSDVELHDAFCEMFLPTQAKQMEFYNRVTGETVSVETDGRRSSKLTGAPFYDFVERVRDFARDFYYVETPDPDPEYWRRNDEERAA